MADRARCRERRKMLLERNSAVFVFALLSRAVLIETQKDLHPFLYFNEKDVGGLQHRARTTHAEITASIREVVETMKRTPKRYLPPERWDEYASRWNEQFGNNLCVLAFYCVLYENDTQARELAVRFMDTLASHPNWRVKAILRDDVPVAHSLNGMATAFDFLYSVLNGTQRERYLSKITAVTEEMYERSKDRHIWWSKVYLQNHVATNFMALLTGALVVSRHHKSTAEPWIAHAQRVLGRNMEILNGVVDGSMNEGAAYGSYTSRSLTQFVFLALRHLHADLTRNVWLREHFWFIYRTVLPGFVESVGIADSNRNWFYGPESQLVFLDNFVLKNGYGNWLAGQIRRHRPSNSSRVSSQRNCMLHTEFLFYNASIPERAPPAPNKPRLHVFSDWGVVTYGGLQSTLTGSEPARSFLSFKCGVLHGRVVNTLVRNSHVNSPLAKGWKYFNPGHEHPDQGSFVFAPNGVPFITDTLYGPKYTRLNNALVFGPSDTSPCLGPDEGQIGECGQWFDYKMASAWTAQGEILGASSEGSMVFMSGDMNKWYRASLGLQSVYRSLVLLTPSVLLAVDSIDRASNSSVGYMRAFFHNIDKPFALERHASGFPAAKATLEGGDHMIIWLNAGDVSGGDAHVGTWQFKSGAKIRETHYFNVTTPLTRLHTRVAYLFAGPGNSIGPAHVISVGDRGVRVTISLNGVKHTVSIATKPFQPYARYDFLGFGGFAKVQISDQKTVRFGLDSFASSPSPASPAKTALQVKANIVSPNLLSVVVLCVLIFLFLQLGRRIPLRTFWRVAFAVLGLLWCTVSLVTYSYFCSQGGCVWKHVVILKPPSSTLLELPVRPPFVVYTSLPLAGAELGKHFFHDNTDFVHTNLSALHFDETSKTSKFDHFNIFLDPCTLYERYNPHHKYARVSKWFRQLLNKGPTTSSDESQEALPVVKLEDPGWSLKLPWLRKVLYSRMRAFIIVRDPRAWVHAWLSELHDSSRLGQAFLAMFTNERRWRCPKASLLEPEYRGMFSVMRKSNRDAPLKLHKLLAYLWMTHMNATLRLTKNVPRNQLLFVRFEDLVTKPKSAAQRLYRFLGLSLPPAVEHKTLQVFLTGKFSLGNSREKLDAQATTAWKRMKTEQIREISEICSPVMKKLYYDI